MSSLYASFPDAADAERAAGALLDRGAHATDITILANEGYATARGQQAITDSAVSEQTAKSGLTTTTAGDAAIGAAKGSMIGIGAGIAAALASLLIPGVGLVIGGGALASAVAGAAGAAVAGAAAGGVAGFLKDQGVGQDLAMTYSSAFEQGASILSIRIPSGDLTAEQIEPILVKYGATNVATQNQPTSLMDRPTSLHEPPMPLTADGGTPVIGTGMPVTAMGPGTTVTTAGIPVPTTGGALHPTSLTTMGTTPTTAGAVAAAAAAINSADVRPTVVDPVTGTMREGVIVDPLTGVEHPVHMVNGAIVYKTPIVTQPAVVSPMAVEPVMAQGFTMNDIQVTERDPVTGAVVHGYVIDPATNGQRPVRVVNGSIVYADMPATGHSQVIHPSEPTLDRTDLP